VGLQIASSRPPRCELANTTTGETIECLFNPTQFNEKVQVNYTRLAVQGLSHQPLQYQNTGNRQMSGVEFYLDKFFAKAQPNDPDIVDFSNFLRALTVPPSGAQTVLQTAPPHLLFVWPSVLTIETVITDLEFQYRQFASDASVLVYTATCAFEEILDSRVTSEDRRSGA
jgi:hypothetical protein